MLSKIPFVAVFIENRFLKFVHLKAKAGGSAADFRKQKISEVRKIGENLAVGSEYKCYALRVARAETRLTVYPPLQVVWSRSLLIGRSSSCLVVGRTFSQLRLLVDRGVGQSSYL